VCQSRAGLVPETGNATVIGVYHREKCVSLHNETRVGLVLSTRDEK